MSEGSDPTVIIANVSVTDEDINNRSQTGENDPPGRDKRRLEQVDEIIDAPAAKRPRTRDMESSLSTG